MTIIKTPVYTDPSSDSSRCSNRILVLAIAAILFLTLYPFRFDFGRHLSHPLFPLSLGGWGKGIGRFDDLLNLLLFVPFGFGLAEIFRTRGKSRLATLGFCLAAGALLSYAVEFLQIYIPQRDSGWEDIFTNSFGAVVGGVLFELCGGAAIWLLSAIEQKVSIWLIWQRAVLLLLLYIAIWSGIAVGLQEEARLNNWNSDALLVIGNSASNRFTSAWKGRVFELEIWDRAVSAEVARKLVSRDLADPPADDSIAEYRFLGSPRSRTNVTFSPIFLGRLEC